MKKTSKIISKLIFLVLSFGSINAAELKLEISNIKSSSEKSSIYIAVFDSKASHKNKEAAIGKKVDLDSNASSSKVISLNGFEVGKQYAIAVYQDINGNEKLDSNFFRVPTEPFGFSNNIKPGMLGPSYKKFVFTFEKDAQEMKINLN